MAKIFRASDFPGLMRKARAFLAPEAFEQRERDRQRAELVRTLESINHMREWCKDVEPRVRERLHKLNRIDLGLDTPAADGKYYVQPPATAERLPHGEYLRVPRTMRDAFGHGRGLEVDTDDAGFYRSASWLVILAGSIAIVLGVMALWTK